MDATKGHKHASQRVSEFRKRKLVRMAEAYDADGDGYVTQDDFLILARRAIESGKFPEEKAKKTMELYANIFRHYFNEDDLPVTPEQVANNILATPAEILTVDVTNAFSALFDGGDPEGNGLMSQDQYVKFSSFINIDENTARKAFKLMDTIQQDGKLSKSEFILCALKYFMSCDERCPSKYLYGII